MSKIVLAWALGVSFILGACSGSQWNNPYPKEHEGKNILYSSFAERPKHLDPGRSYSSNEYAFLGQIYEPPLQYHYLKRPYELIPLTASAMPTVRLFDKQGRELAPDADIEKVAYSIYTINIQPGIQYQPHPIFARDEQGNYRYHQLSAQALENIFELRDFEFSGTRELLAADYIHQIKRLAYPPIHSPILGLMAEHIIGLGDFAKQIGKLYKQAKDEGRSFVDLTQYDIEGVKQTGPYQYQIKVNGSYPQLLYWLAMPFFAPMPPEADVFYAQTGLAEKNINLNWYPVGTGAYMLTVNNPNREMVLQRNPNFRGMPYPSEGAPGDEAMGLIADAGKTMPFIDEVVFKLEKESIPYWNKFLQGYYDTSGINSESFDQAIQMTGQGDMQLTEEMQAKGIRLSTAVATSTYYMGFNMRDPVVGGLNDRARKLRQAISIAMDYEEFISIFANGRGISAQGPLPPGLFGYREGVQGINPYVYDWVDGKAKRKPVSHAKKLLAEAGYANGIDSKTGKPLTLYLDITASGPDDKARLNWYRKQFQKLDIQLVIRNTQYNRFQEKMHKGTAQIFIWGWNADYPDPENFLFLLYGPNSKVDHQGENAANYENKAFDRLFSQMKNMSNSPKRQQIIDTMVHIVQKDAPWIWGMNPKQFGLYHQWYLNAKPNLMSHNTMMYKRIDAQLRDQQRQQWNKPVVWPLWLLFILLLISIVPAVISFRRREQLAPAEGGA